MELQVENDRLNDIDNKNIAAIYVRISTVTQMLDGLGLEGQIDTCKKLCEIKKLKIYKIYRDEAVSGTTETETREGFTEMLTDAEYGKFNIIVFYKLDRLGRKMSVIINTIEKLHKLNIKPIFVEDNLDTTTDEGMLMFNIYASVSDHEIKIIKKRLRSGLRSKQLLDGCIGGTLPYGYSRVDKKIEIDPYQSAIVKYIFNLHNKGISMNKIAKILTEYNIKTKKGKTRWYSNTVKCIIDNKLKYQGLELVNNNENNIYWAKIL